MADRRILEWNGTAFENIIQRCLSVKYPNAVLLHDLELYSYYLKKETQIDILMIHPNGIFVIEAKSWKRWVQGDYDDNRWLGRGLSADTLMSFSPVNQNFIHIRSIRNALRRELGVEPPCFHNIICFPDSAVLVTECSEVVNLSALCLHLDKLILTSKVKINVEEWCQLVKSVTNSNYD